MPSCPRSSSLSRRPNAARASRPRHVRGPGGDAQRLAVLLAVAERMPGVAFSVVGRGPERAQLEARASQRGLRNVEFTAHVSPFSLLESYRAADILFAQVRSTPTLDQTAMPSKLMEYMASGRPVIYAGNGHGGPRDRADRLRARRPPGGARCDRDRDPGAGRQPTACGRARRGRQGLRAGPTRGAGPQPPRCSPRSRSWSRDRARSRAPRL